MIFYRISVVLHGRGSHRECAAVSDLASCGAAALDEKVAMEAKSANTEISQAVKEDDKQRFEIIKHNLRNKLVGAKLMAAKA